LTGETLEISAVRKAAKRRNSVIDFIIRMVKQKPMGTVGAVIVLMLFLTGIFADVLAPYGATQIDLTSRLSSPSSAHLLGTDHLGRDLFSRIIYGARVSMFVGLGASTLDTFIALLIGIVSGYFGGKIDLVMQRIVDAIIVFPNLFFYLAIMSIIGPGMGQVIFCLGFLSGVGSSRLIRSAVMGAKQNAYIDASKAIGAPNIKILLRHILPNVSAPAIIIFTIAMGSVIVAEASLSFLGFGIPPPAPSWGGMLSREARRYMTDAPWIGIFPGVALSLVVYGINMFGDAMRDLLDPRLRGGVGGLGEFGMVKARKALDKKLNKGLKTDKP